MDVEIVSIGGEVLSGMTLNSNALFLSRALTDRGFSVRRHTVVADNIPEIRAALEEALGRSSWVIATGGLGPTIDDVTREAASSCFKEKPAELKNGLGTAPGAFGSRLILLPGVPREMEAMFLTEALPLLERSAKGKRLLTRHATLCLLRELEVDPFLRTLKTPDVEIGIYPSYGSLQVTFKSERPVDPEIEKLKKQFPTFFVGEGTVAEALHREMISRNKTLCLAESCTGGAIAARLVSIPDASLYFAGSIVSYSNQWKERFLKVRHDTISRHGAVSCETVQEMVEGLFEETDCDYAIAVSGTFGPKGGSAQKPVGTVFIAVAKRKEPIDIGRLSAPKDRAAAIEFTVQTALGALWRRLIHNTPTFI